MPDSPSELPVRDWKVWRCALWILPVAIIIVAPVPSVHAQTIPAALQRFLEKYAEFDASDLARLAAGQPVAKVSQTKAGDEVAVVGAIRIAVPREFYLERFTQIVQFMRQQGVSEAGKFRNPPALNDLAELHLQEKSLEDLRKCREGKCGMKLPAESIARFRKEISWSSPDAVQSANNLFREILLNRVRAYLASGNAGLAAYNDKKLPNSLARESDRLVLDSAYLRQFAPRLADCLRLFPACDSGIESFFYWSKENYGHGLKPVVSMTHVMIDRPPAVDSQWIWEASKQLYADHYSNGSLGVTLMVDAQAESGKPSFYLVYLNRTRSDTLHGFFSFFIGGIIRGEARNQLSDRLERLRARMESLWTSRTSEEGK